jgi:hypothetical protein
MALNIIAGGVVLVALVLSLRVKRDDITKLAEAFSRWFR